MTGSLWGLLTILGPILLIGAIAWAMLNNRRSAKAEQHTEAATKNLYEKIDRQDKATERGDA